MHALSILTSVLAVLVAFSRLRAKYLRAAKASSRRKAISYSSERVLIVGASSGVGREIALQYTKRGARVAIIGRRSDQLGAVLDECVSAAPFETRYLAITADFAAPESAARARQAIEDHWNGLDTLVITAGVSAVRLFMDSVKSSKPGVADLQRAREIATAAADGNLVAPLVAAAAFLPMMESSSSNPAILLLSSVAAVIPAPSRALYAATKASSLLFYQALAIEHPRITFSIVLPGTIEGDFRASAVDVPAVSTPVTYGDQDSNSTLSKKLSRSKVALRCIEAADHGDRTVWMPSWYQFAHALYWIVPSAVERGARKKYNVK
ncbi:NAD(P)-binding protein [Clavulina sp. PMI_390]|nr:NAD(P)-binding protein [Clavulina sp. PMI_390]